MERNSLGKFIVSTDSCADFFKSYLEKRNIYCITVKRILKGKKLGEIYDSAEEFDSFYTELKKGALPTTSEIGSYEMREFFEEILEKEKSGDIIHVALSSGLSPTCNNARIAANELNKNELTDRKIYVVDSLVATGGMGQLVDNLVKMRDNEVETLEAIKKIEKMRDYQQTWVIVSDLHHLKRGGRISGFAAAMGSWMNVKPIIVMSKKGKLAIENKVKGDRKAVEYVLDKVREYGASARPDFSDNTVYFYYSSKNSIYDELRQTFMEIYPNVVLKESRIGPVIGTHVGSDCAAISFEGVKRLDIEDK
ncbi:MAG: DegV family protein [Firmicutes bacterium]|nr:DegV family protein [Bacillota bacterium]